MKALLGFVSAALYFSPATANQNFDVNDCEFYVDDFAVVSSGAYGYSKTDLVANLVMRSDLNAKVVGVDSFFSFEGKYTTYSKAADGSDKEVVFFNSNEQGFFAGERSINGQTLQVTFPLTWANPGQDAALRTLKNFTYRVAVKSDSGESINYWLKDAGHNFSAESIAEPRYYYSHGVYLGGYSSAKYLWRDSGSPLFANRKSCLAR